MADLYRPKGLSSAVSYIDPKVIADTRTDMVRIEVPKPGGDLRLGMYADVLVARATGSSSSSHTKKRACKRRRR